MNIKIFDSIHDEFIINKKPKKIVSLVPSITETLIDLNLRTDLTC